MFEQWKEGELASIKSEFGKVRLFTGAIAAFMVLSALGSVVMLLDGGGAAQILALVFQLAIAAFAWTMGDYKKRFVKPLLVSVEEVLPTQGEREEFARQMDKAVQILYQPNPQVKACPLWMGPDYAYFRCPRRSRIWKNRDLRRAKMAQETYTVGRGHVRSCCSLSLFTSEEKPIWKGYFRGEGEVYPAWELLRPNLPSNLELDDQIAYGKTEEGRKASRKEALVQFLLAALLVGAMILLVKLL